MENNNTSKRIHPLTAAAAVSIMVVCLVGVAAMTGLLPNSNSTTAPTATPPPTTAAETTQTAPLAKNKPVTPAHSPQAKQVARASPICKNCGKVESVEARQEQAKPSGVGVVAGAVLGGVVGNQIGGGSGKTLATVAGAVGGGYAGNEIEKRTRSTTTYSVHVRMADGSVRTFPQSSQDGWRVGDRVKVVNGALTSPG